MTPSDGSSMSKKNKNQQMQEERAIKELHRLKDMLESNPLLWCIGGNGGNMTRSANTAKTEIEFKTFCQRT